MASEEKLLKVRDGYFVQLSGTCRKGWKVKREVGDQCCRRFIFLLAYPGTSASVSLWGNPHCVAVISKAYNPSPNSPH
jgi:hypothetical protein